MQLSRTLSLFSPVKSCHMCHSSILLLLPYAREVYAPCQSPLSFLASTASSVIDSVDICILRAQLSPHSNSLSTRSILNFVASFLLPFRNPYRCVLKSQKYSEGWAASSGCLDCSEKSSPRCSKTQPKVFMLQASCHFDHEG